MNGKSLLIAAAALLAALSSLPAGATGGLYLGAGVGEAAVKVDTSAGTLDESHTAYKGFVGYRFDQIPLVDLAVEAAYAELGSPSATLAGQEVKYKLHGPQAAGLVILPIGPLDLYGKAGVHSWKSELTVGASTTSRSGSDGFYGAGVGFYLWKLGIRAEYERYRVKDVDRVEMFSVNALFQF